MIHLLLNFNYHINSYIYILSFYGILQHSQVNKMSSPKIEIINHFDNLINNVDIDIELCIEKCNDKEILGELLESSAIDRKNFRKENDCFNVELHNTIESPKNNIWTKSTKVINQSKLFESSTNENNRRIEKSTI